ncbi:PKAR, partial [Symbiodinium microadriaticum]
EYLSQHKIKKEMNKAVKELLKTAMKQDRVCAILEESEVEAILSTMEYFEFEQGSLIVEQGKMGTTFFVTDTGTLEVSVNGNVVNTLKEGKAFGGLALLYNCPRTATVQALSKAGVWGANGNNFKQVLAQNAANRQADNLKFLDSIKVFDGLNQKQKDQIALSAFSEAFEAGQRVATQGESLAAIYFVKRGGLSVMSGGEVKADGKFQGGVQAQKLSSGEYIGAALLLSQKQRPSWDHTLLADAKTELLCISVKDLKEVLGNDLGGILESALVQKGLRMCPVMSQFSSTQRNDIAKSVVIKDLKSGGALPDGVRYVIVLEGTISGTHKEEKVTLERAQWLEDGGLLESNAASEAKSEIRNFVAGSNGARVGYLTKEGLLGALKELGLAAIGNAEEASDLTRKLIVAKKVHIFRHLSSEQINKASEEVSGFSIFHRNSGLKLEQGPKTQLKRGRGELMVDPFLPAHQLMLFEAKALPGLGFHLS